MIPIAYWMQRIYEQLWVYISCVSCLLNSIFPGPELVGFVHVNIRYKCMLVGNDHYFCADLKICSFCFRKLKELK